MSEISPDKGFKFPVEMLTLSEINLKKAFSKEFLDFLEEINTKMVGMTMGIEDSVVTIGSDFEAEGFFFSMPAVDDERRKKIFEFFDIVVMKEEKDNEETDANNDE